MILSAVMLAPIGIADGGGELLTLALLAVGLGDRRAQLGDSLLARDRGAADAAHRRHSGS